MSPAPGAPSPVAIGMTLHNRAAYLAEAVDSLLAQSHPHFALVLVDDGSTDDTEAIARSYERRDPRVRYVKLPSRRGMIEAWRTAFQAASATGARYFAWASDHDRWHPQWIEKLMGDPQSPKIEALTASEAMLQVQRHCVRKEYETLVRMIQNGDGSIIAKSSDGPIYRSALQLFHAGIMHKGLKRGQFVLDSHYRALLPLNVVMPAPPNAHNAEQEKAP